MKIPNSILRSCLFALAIASVNYSCQSKKDNPTPEKVSKNSIYVVNEGNFGSANGSVSYIQKDSAKVIQDIYSQNNSKGTTKVTLGASVQSFSIIDDKGFILTNSPGKIVVVDMNGFSDKGEVPVNIQNFTPRYLVDIGNGRAIVSEWNDNKLLVIDTKSLTVLKTITTAGLGPEGMLVNQNKVWVCFSGGFTKDNKVAILDINSLEIEKYLTVGANPKKALLDRTGKVWILCSGSYNANFTGLDKGASLLRMNASTYATERQLDFNDLTSNGMVQNLAINPAGDNLYYSYQGKIYSVNIESNALPSSAFINRDFYGLSVDPTDGKIMGCPPSFTSNTFLVRYSALGAKVDSFQVGIGGSLCTYY